MGIAYLIIGFVALWILRAVTENQKTQCRNQVQISELLKELINESSQKDIY
jgi:hypothetical protein|tara:strand:+ start:2087 stop:2239 length:153 start_codon:yes stop_codon:yes gene_type:complete